MFLFKTNPETTNTFSGNPRTGNKSIIMPVPKCDITSQQYGEQRDISMPGVELQITVSNCEILFDFASVNTVITKSSNFILIPGLLAYDTYAYGTKTKYKHGYSSILTFRIMSYPKLHGTLLKTARNRNFLSFCAS
jgi:hypothetical protein